MRQAIAILLLLLPATGFAGKCDYLVKRAGTTQGDALVRAYSDLLKCDQELAQSSFDEFMRNSKDVGTLVDLSMVAIRAKTYTPVWSMLEKIPDYGARDEVSKGIGSKCNKEPEVVTFLKGAYYGLRGRQFSQFESALITCNSPELTTWLEEVVATPPSASYDEKYNAVITAYVKQKRGNALPILERAAVAAAGNGGPFNTVIEKMEQAVQPVFGEDMTDEEKAKLEASLITVAGAVIPEQAAMVADRLYNSGNQAAAASLLPRVYPDRVQSGGRLMYGVAAIESCDSQTVVHYTAVYEPSKRWSILEDVTDTARGFKARLKCESNDPWPVLSTSEPLARKADVDTWVNGLVEQWVAKGHETKSKSEKDISLD
ncbi:MAG: hypothetical protein HN348_14800 [Proteobacteria bacterium]|jgi:hypothetical protein|nr:hypothetical protein [Pseudomonadota bacterium]